MEMKAKDLPDTIDELRALVLSQQQTIKAIENQLAWAEEKYRAMELRYFGRKSEKYSAEDDHQGRLFDEAEAYQDPEAPAVVENIIEPSPQRAKRGRKPKTDNLPVREVLHDIAENDRPCPCCGKDRPVIGDERSSEYHLVPAYVEKIIHIRKKYGPCSCDGFLESACKEIITAPGPAKIVPGSDFSNASIAFFVTGKYADAIPYYRMTLMLARSGLVVSRQTLCNLAIGAARGIGELTNMMALDLAQSPVMLMDETTLQVLGEGSGPPKKSYMWAMRGYHDGKPIVRFAYHANRSGSFADTLLKGFRGYLQTDGYAGYNHLEDHADIEHVGCFAHIRRKFVEAWEAAGKSGRSKEAVDLLAGVYALESKFRKRFTDDICTEEAFLEMRKAHMEAVFTDFKIWLQNRLMDTAPQSALGKAVSYALKVLPRAVRFVEHSLLTPDTNMIENAIRPFVVGRKNWLFSGSPLGAHSSAALYSLIETAKANGHEPYAYLCHVFESLPRCKNNDGLRTLLPYVLTPMDYAATGCN